MKNRSAVVLLAALTLATSGCVVAAIPLAAGAVVAKSRSESGRPSAAPIRASAASDIKVTRLALTELPPPDALTSSPDPAVEAFRTYALAELDRQPAKSWRASALLSQASELRAERAQCSASLPGVFIDLDPGRGAFDPLAPGQPDRELAGALDDLRARGVAVVWFSRLGSGFEAATRAALAEAGLDAAGDDRLVLLGSLDERKQSRRDEVAKQLCPIALLGDERADFDELYLYLKNPESALALDAMIGRGWFLASPFAIADAITKDMVP